MSISTKKENECKELIDIVVDVIKNHKSVLECYLDGMEGKDQGLESWLRLELIAKLKENDHPVTLNSKGYDLKIENYEHLGKVELKANSSFHPCCALDGLIDYKVPVLFFCGYSHKFTKKNTPKLEDKADVFECFTCYVKDKRKSQLKSKSLFLRYKIVQLKEPCIVGILAKSEEPDF